jgi:hypothetical protein
MNLELSDEQAAALERELTAIIDGDRYFLSPRIQKLREIRSMIPTGAKARTAPRTEALRAAALHPRTATARFAGCAWKLET